VGPVIAALSPLVDVDEPRWISHEPRPEPIEVRPDPISFLLSTVRRPLELVPGVLPPAPKGAVRTLVRGLRGRTYAWLAPVEPRRRREADMIENRRT
jgi:hypothetical protein